MPDLPDAGLPEADGSGQDPARQVRSTDRPARRWWVAPLFTGLSMAALLGFLTWQVVVRGPAIAWDWPLHTYVDPRQPGGAGREVLNAVASLGARLESSVQETVGDMNLREFVDKVLVIPDDRRPPQQ
jgi:hypothetical protein